MVSQSENVAVIEPVTFVVAVTSKGEILQDNFLASPCLRTQHKHQILIQEGFVSAATAYNDAIEKAVYDLIVFVHQDVILPEDWLSQLQCSLDHLEIKDPSWGVLGCGGITRDGLGRGHVYSSGLGIIGEPFVRPAPVQTLDEIVLILKKASALRFDEQLPNFHLYGADICMRAASMGLGCYAISAFCVHNTQQNLILTNEFYEAYRHIKQVWKDQLPIQTTCIRISKSNMHLYRRRCSEAYLRYVRRREFGGARVKDVPRLLEEIRAMREQSSVPSRPPLNWRQTRGTQT